MSKEGESLSSLIRRAYANALTRMLMFCINVRKAGCNIMEKKRYFKYVIKYEVYSFELGEKAKTERVSTSDALVPAINLDEYELDILDHIILAELKGAEKRISKRLSHTISKNKWQSILRRADDIEYEVK